MDIALVSEENEAQAVASIQNEIEEMGLPPEQAQALTQAAEAASPQTMLVSLFEDESLSELITIERMDRPQAQQSLDEETVDAVITLPEGFTQKSLRNMLFGSKEGSELELLAADLSSPQTDVLDSILQEFVLTVNFEASISRLSGQESAVEVSGGIETITAREPITSFQYYTIGMAVMFVLFVGSTIAGQANLEQKQMVFDRIRLSNRSPLLYLSSKAIAASAIVTVQLALLFGLSALLFQTFAAESWAFWSGIAIISITLAFSVGCLAALMVAITLRLESDAVPAIFSGGVISLMAFVGGSFMPLDGMPEMLRAIGNWTPNGAALSAYFSWLLEPDLGQLTGPLMRIGIVAVVFLLLALALFPRKGERHESCVLIAMASFLPKTYARFGDVRADRHFCLRHSGRGQSGPQMIPVYADESMSELQAQTWLELLNSGDQFQFELMAETEARSYVAEGDVSQAVNLLETDYRLLVGREDPARFALDSFLRRIYSEELRLENAEQTTPGIRGKWSRRCLTRRCRYRLNRCKARKTVFNTTGNSSYCLA